MLHPSTYGGTFCPDSSRKPEALIPALLPLLEGYGGALGVSSPAASHKRCTTSPLVGGRRVVRGGGGARDDGCFGRFPSPQRRRSPEGGGGGGGGGGAASSRGRLLRVSHASPPGMAHTGTSVPIGQLRSSPRAHGGGGSGGGGGGGGSSPAWSLPEAPPARLSPAQLLGLSGGSTSARRRWGDDASCPPSAGANRRRANLPTSYKRHYDRGDLPLCVLHRGTKNSIDWKITPERLDYHHFLPLFFDGIREPCEPHCSLSVKACYDMLKASPSKAVACVPQIILPIKLALDTRDERCVADVLKLIQFFLLLDGSVGPAFYPFLKQILPMFLMYVKWHRSTGDAVDYSQYSRVNVGDLASETLQLLESKCGRDSCAEIKKIIPTYESCMKPKTNCIALM